MKKLFRFSIGNYIGLFLIALSLLAPGCGVWRDFTTYFNLYYNLSDIYSQAETAMKEQKKNLLDLEEPPIPSNATTLFNQVIEKSSNLLQFNGQSSYVDDALLMLGKAFYYMQNYQKASRKFDELISTQPNSKLVLEAELWSGKTQMRLRNFDKGLQILADVKEKATKVGNGNIITQTLIEEIKYQLRIKNSVAAIEGCKNLIVYDFDSEISAEICYEMGKLHNSINQYDDAIKAFQSVSRYSPTFDVRFNATIELGKTLRLVKKNDEALKIFQKMRTEAKYSDKYDVIELETGLSFMELGKYDKAINKLVIVDTGFATSLSAGTARFFLAKIFEEKYLLFDSAAVYYKKTATQTSAPEYQEKAIIKNAIFTKYFGIRSQLKDQEKQLNYIKHPEEFARDSAKFVEDTTRLGMMTREANDEANIRKSFEQFTNSMGRNIDTSKIKTDTSKTKTDTSKIDSSKIKNKLPDNKPPDNKIGESNQNRDTTGNYKAMAQLSKLQGTAPVKPQISADSATTLIVKSRYDMGNVFYADFNMVDSAVYYYSNILKDYPGAKLTPQVSYSLGNCYESLNNKEKADSLFNVIYNNYKTENIVNAAALKLKKPQIDLNYDPADSSYIEAEKTLRKKDYSASVNGFYGLYMKYPKSALAPKALLAAGWVLENDLKLSDSAAAVYDTIVTKYPKSIYASAIKGKLDVYRLDREKKKSAAALANSIAAAAADSAKKSALALKPENTDKDAKPANTDDKKVEEKINGVKRDELAQKDVPAVKNANDSKITGVSKEPATPAEIKELKVVTGKIEEFEKLITTLKSEQNSLQTKLAEKNPKLSEAIKQLSETKANLENMKKNNLVK